MNTPKKNPLALKLSDDTLIKVQSLLVEHIRTGKQARSMAMDDHGLIDFAYSLYEQRSQQPISQAGVNYAEPDLTSPIGTETVDTLSSRASQTLFRLEPFWIVEGIGEDAKKAPIVETFMQFRQEDMRFQKVAKRAITASFVETGSVLEVCEDTDRIVCHELVKAKIAKSEIDQTFLLDGKTGKPLPMLDEDGYPVPADESYGDAFVEVAHTYEDYKRRGGYIRRRSMKDFMFLPNHAEDEREVWAHATRFWLTSDDVQRRVDSKQWRKEVLERIGLDTNERQQTAEADRAGVNVAYTPGTGTAEHEFWQVQLWADLDGKGLTCYTAVVSEIHGLLCSIEYDWLKRWRTIYLNPYPCPYSIYGYSTIFTKLGTTIEEHTAWRNMNAKRSTLKASAPLKRLNGSQWDPTIQPFGPDAVIDVARHDEITPFEFEDVTSQALNKEQQCVTDAQRIIGINDIAIGQLSGEKRTLGENEMATRQSFVRTDDPLGNLQEAFEEVGTVLHAIEVQSLKELGSIEAPAGVTQALKYTNEDFAGQFTPDMISGEFRFKPRGSSDAADPNQQKKELNDLIGTLANFGKVNPRIQQRLMSEDFGDALMQMVVERWKPRDREPFLKPLPAPVMPGMGGVPPGMGAGGLAGVPSPHGMPQAGARPNFGGEQLVAQLMAGQGGAQ